MPTKSTTLKSKLSAEELAPVKAIQRPVVSDPTNETYKRAVEVFADYAGNLVALGGYVGFAREVGLTIEQAETIWGELEGEAGK